MIDYPWDLVERNAEALEQDGQEWCAGRGAADRTEVPVVGPRERFVADPEARIEPMVVVDTTRGPVLVDRGAVVQAFSRLEGPCYIGPETQVVGARVRGSSFGPQCRVGGEVECSVVQGYSNKAHDGFLGHSYLGEWVNLGAGTQVSDLRVDYGPVSVSLAGRKVDTGLIKVGAYLGDHTKTSVAVLINQGTVAGPFSLLLTSGGLLPRVLPPFSQFAHGQIQERSDLRQLFGTAATVLARRGRQWTAAHAELFFGLFERTEAGRRQLIRASEQRRLRRVV
jgi:UDP-N-acetylglucosamine diphosphorylase/glucosamine-1-phosphate N-acetyltransferase